MLIFVTSQSHHESEVWFWFLFFFGGMTVYFGTLIQKITIWVVMESNGLEMDSMTNKPPDNMYHT